MDDAYGSCAETRAELLVYPGALAPIDVTQRLQLEPTEVSFAGETKVNSRGRTRTAKSSWWSLSSGNHVRSLDVRPHLDWLLAALVPRAESLRELQSVPGVRMSVNCVWYSRSGHGGPTLWPEQMGPLAELDLECSFDVYLLGEEPEA